jgi:adenylate cyclase
MKGFRARPGSEPDEPSVAREILGEAPEFNAGDVAEQTGLSVDDARRLWRALGFPEHGDDRAFNRADVAAVSTLVSGVESGTLDFDLVVTLTRAVGQTMARLADWEVAAMLPRIEELHTADDTSTTRLDAARRLLEEFGTPFEELLVYSWRRHLAAAVARIEALGAEEEDLSTSQLSVGFADIVSFTALSNDISREQIGDLVEVFESRCADVVTRNNGRMIKSIGDSVLFVNDDPIRAYDTAEGIISVIGRDKRMPDVRVGLASGSVVMRMGDVFGPPVNMAARLTAVARRNRIIIDAATARLLPEDQFETRRLPARPMRGFGILEPVAVRRH